METPQRSLRARVAEEIYTYIAFWLAVFALPILAVSYLGKYLSIKASDKVPETRPH